MGSLSVAGTTIDSSEFRQILGVRFFVGGGPTRRLQDRSPSRVKMFRRTAIL